MEELKALNEVMNSIAQKISETVKSKEDINKILGKMKINMSSFSYPDKVVDSMIRQALGLALGFGVDPDVVKILEREGIRHPFLQGRSVNDVCYNECAIATLVAVRNNGDKDGTLLHGSTAGVVQCLVEVLGVDNTKLKNSVWYPKRVNVS